MNSTRVRQPQALNVASERQFATEAQTAQKNLANYLCFFVALPGDSIRTLLRLGSPKTLHLSQGRKFLEGHNMNFLKLPLVLLLSICVSGLLAITPAGAQGQTTALERGYRTGYSDGYNAGFKDISESAARDYKNKEDYQHADRSYNDAWGPIEDYRDGYQQGFEAGYTAGYERQQFNSSLPTGLHRRGNGGTQAIDVNVSTPTNNTAPNPDASANTDTAVTP